MPVGVQFPTASLVPSAKTNHWEDVRDLCKAYGLVLDEWQEHVMRGALGERADGRWSATRVGLCVPRQSGKTAIFEARELAGLLLFDEQTLVHSAHLVATALEGFHRIKGYFENYDDLRRKVRRVREANGEQSIEMMSGQRLLFKARARGGGRGFSADTLLLDEAQILPERALSAIFPTMSARPNPQAWLAGTPPGPEDDGEAFTRLRLTSQTAADKRLCYMEWAAPDGPMPDVDDRKIWALTNPGLNVRITTEAILDERHSLDEPTFARERLGWWAPVDAEDLGVIDLVAWAKLARPEAKPPARATVAIDVSPNRRSASIGIAADGAGDRALVLCQTQAGTAWLVPALARLIEARDVVEVVLHPSSQAGALIPDLIALDIEYVALTSTEMGQACAAFQTAVIEGTVEHVGQPELDAAVANARTRYVGESELYDRRDRAVDISPLVSVSAAAFRWAKQSEYDVLDSIF